MRERASWLLLLGLACVGCNAFAGAEKELTGSGGASHGSSSGAGGTSVTSGSGGGSTGTGAGVEDCTNGVDDNNDGLIDCDDPQCQDFACVEAPPAGWTKPGAFYLGAEMNQLPPCPPNDPTPKVQGGFDVMADPDACSNCQCGSRSGQSCTGVNITTYPNTTDCTGTKQNNVSTDNHCATGLFGAMSVDTTTNYLPGMCTPSTVMITNRPAPTFSKRGLVCVPDAVGKCSQANMVCAATVGGAFGPKACISKDGDEICPAGYPNKTILYQGTTDNRDCTKCACDPPGNDCKAAVTYYEGGNGDCNASNPPGTVINNVMLGTCTALTPQALSVKIGALSWPSATDGCTASGGTPTGTVVGAMPITVCCR